MALQESGEMYLETILVLSKEKPDLHAIDICDKLGYSKPSVSRAVGILKNDGYITVDAHQHIRLTEEGEKIAKKIFERHTVLAAFLERLGVEAGIADEDACKIEHVISDETFKAIKEYKF